MGLIILFIVGFFVVSNFAIIVSFLSEFLSSIGMSVRTLTMLQNNSFVEDESRSFIIQTCLSYIQTHPIRGTGMINDRIYLYNTISLR